MHTSIILISHGLLFSYWLSSGAFVFTPMVMRVVDLSCSCSVLVLMLSGMLVCRGELRGIPSFYNFLRIFGEVSIILAKNIQQDLPWRSFFNGRSFNYKLNFFINTELFSVFISFCVSFCNFCFLSNLPILSKFPNLSP